MQSCYGCEEQFDVAKAGFRGYCRDCQLVDRDHKQVMTRYGFTVDEKLVDIIVLLNDKGYLTENSCQDQEHLGHKTWIQFSDHDEVKQLLRLIRTMDREFYEFMAHEAEWTICFDEDSDDVPNVYSSLGLRFPSKHLDYFKERIVATLS